MGKKISTYYTENNRGHCEVHVDFKEEMCYLKYYDDNGKMYFREDYPNKTVRYVENKAEDWALGIKKLEESNR